MPAQTVKGITTGMHVRPIDSSTEYRVVVGVALKSPVATVYLEDGTHFEVPLAGDVDRQ